MNALQSVNHVLDRLAHTLRIMGAIELPDDTTTPFTLPAPFETGLSAALRAVRIEQHSAAIIYGGYKGNSDGGAS